MTLAEVLVALMVLSAAEYCTFVVVDRALTTVDDGAVRESALMVAQGDLLCAARGQRQGISETGTRTQTVGVHTFVADVTERPVGAGLERMCVTVRWGERGKERDVCVSTWQAVSTGDAITNAGLS